MTHLKSFYVSVDWPGNKQPWLVLIKATSKKEARKLIETSEDVVRAGGKVVRVEEADAG